MMLTRILIVALYVPVMFFFLVYGIAHSLKISVLTLPYFHQDFVRAWRKKSLSPLKNIEEE